MPLEQQCPRNTWMGIAGWFGYAGMLLAAGAWALTLITWADGYAMAASAFATATLVLFSAAYGTHRLATNHAADPALIERLAGLAKSSYRTSYPLVIAPVD